MYNTFLPLMGRGSGGANQDIYNDDYGYKYKYNCNFSYNYNYKYN